MNDLPSGATELVIVAHGLCAAAYLVLAGLVLMQATRARVLNGAGALLSAACLATAAWAVAGAVQWRAPMAGAAGLLDLSRALLLYAFTLHLYHRVDAVTRPAAVTGPFAWLGLTVLVAALAATLAGATGTSGRLGLASPAITIRLALGVCQLLLLENLYRNLGEAGRWHVNPTCIALGGLAAYDIALCADAALFHALSPALVTGRPLVAVVVAPLLALAVARNRRWRIDIHVSRRAAFHSATLVVSGVFLLALAAAGELARRLGRNTDGGWGGVAQVTLLFAGVLTLAVLLSSASARAAARGLLIDHFFTSRFDYRREWMRCTSTLSGEAGRTPLPARAIQAVAQIVDSPAGVLLLREPPGTGLHWAGSWNMPALAPIGAGHGLLSRIGAGDGAVVLGDTERREPPLDALAECWLAIPLRQESALAGCVVLARSRAPFRLDREVLDLLRVVASDVATYLAEQRATRALVETKELRARGERFAFVAHDIKNVASQLSLLLSNAERHLANPEFQRDMLATVAASVRKITALIQRLREADASPLPDPRGETDAGARLRDLAARARELRGAAVDLEVGTEPLAIAMPAEEFDAAVTHLLDNAMEAAGIARPTTIRAAREAAFVAVEIADRGPGMTPEFVRDWLFRPWHSAKPGGSGIGAYQARALLRAAGGDLLVASTPGAGTTMRLLVPAAPIGDRS